MWLDSTTAPAARELDLTLELKNADAVAAPLRVQVVDQTGASVVWQGVPTRSIVGLEVKVAKTLDPGFYSVQLYDASGRQVTEYAFRVNK